MPQGTGRGDGDPGSISHHFGYLESFDISGYNGIPLVKAYRRSGDAGRKLDPGKSADFTLKEYIIFETDSKTVPFLRNGKYEIPWIHIAHLHDGLNVSTLSDNDLKLSEEQTKESGNLGNTIEQLETLLNTLKGLE